MSQNKQPAQPKTNPFQNCPCLKVNPALPGYLPVKKSEGQRRNPKQPTFRLEAYPCYGEASGRPSLRHTSSSASCVRFDVTTKRNPKPLTLKTARINFLPKAANSTQTGDDKLPPASEAAGILGKQFRPDEAGYSYRRRRQQPF